MGSTVRILIGQCLVSGSHEFPGRDCGSLHLFSALVINHRPVRLFVKDNALGWSLRCRNTPLKKRHFAAGVEIVLEMLLFYLFFKFFTVC